MARTNHIHTPVSEVWGNDYFHVNGNIYWYKLSENKMFQPIWNLAQGHSLAV